MKLILMETKKSELRQRVHSEALQAAANYRRSEITLIEILEKVDAHRVFYHYGFSSLFTYVTGALGLSEEVAYIFIGVARKTREVPALKEEIRKGSITVAKAKRLTAVLNPQNQEHWLDVAKTSSKRELERHVAMASPEAAVREKMEYVRGGVEEKSKLLNLPKLMVQIQTAVTEKVMMDLRRIQDLESQRMQRSATLADILGTMAEIYLKKEDPLAKAKRQKLRGNLQQGPGLVNVDGASKRRPLKASVRHQLKLKFQNQCAYRDNSGKRCPQRRFLHVHHIIPLSEGGSDSFENLEILCAGHHRAHHQPK